MVVAAKIIDEAAGWGLTLSVLKIKLIVAGVRLSSTDMAPLQFDGGAIEVIKEFKYLESLVEATGTMTGEIDHCIVQGSKAFGSFAVQCYVYGSRP